MLSLDDFKDLVLIEHGSFCSVYKATHKETNTIVAIKQFYEQLGDIVMAQIPVLMTISHPNLTNPYSVFISGDSLCLAEQYMDLDLRKFFNRMMAMTIAADLIKSYAYQILNGLRYLHSNRIVHCCLHPENILINRNGILKITDFTLTRRVGDSDTQNNCPCWYAAPEVLTGAATTVDPSVDIWSAGCIIAEMVTRYPLFMGDSDVDTAHIIYNALDNPNHSKLEAIRSKVGSNDSAFLDLISRLLCVNPHERITAADALVHPYFSDLSAGVVNMCSDHDHDSQGTT